MCNLFVLLFENVRYPKIFEVILLFYRMILIVIVKNQNSSFNLIKYHSSEHENFFLLIYYKVRIHIQSMCTFTKIYIFLNTVVSTHFHKTKEILLKMDKI